MPAQAEAVSRHEPDIVCLQEVTEERRSHWSHHLREDGLEHFTDSSYLLSGRPKQTFVASRWPLVTLPTIPAPQPERVLSVVIDSPWGQIEVHNAHVPNGSEYGLVKVATFEAIHERLARPCERHRILCGDFNAPRSEGPNGEVETFAVDHPRHAERWDAAERSVITGLAEWDLADLYRALHGYGARETTWERQQAARFGRAPLRPRLRLGEPARGQLRLPPRLARDRPLRPLGRRGAVRARVARGGAARPAAGQPLTARRPERPENAASSTPVRRS